MQNLEELEKLKLLCNNPIDYMRAVIKKITIEAEKNGHEIIGPMEYSANHYIFCKKCVFEAEVYDKDSNFEIAIFHHKKNDDTIYPCDGIK
jgi:hypothetical protein